MKKIIIGLMILSLLAVAGCNFGSDTSKELELKEKELALKEKELELKDKESDETDESDEDDSEESVSKSKKKSSKSKKESSSKSSDNKEKSTPKPKATTDPNSKEFFVILGSTPHSKKEGITEVMTKARARGLDVKIIDTTKYPGMQSNLFAVVMGPYSKPVANHELQKARLVSNGAYVKSGY